VRGSSGLAVLVALLAAAAAAQDKPPDPASPAKPWVGRQKPPDDPLAPWPLENEPGSEAPLPLPATPLDTLSAGVEAPLVHGLVPRAKLGEFVGDMLKRVGLDAGFKGRYPHQFSGGQRSRIGIARALAVSPKFLVCDEASAAENAGAKRRGKEDRRKRRIGRTSGTRATSS